MKEKNKEKVILVNAGCYGKPPTKLECLIMMLSNNAQYFTLISNSSRRTKWLFQSFDTMFLKFYKKVPQFATELLLKIIIRIILVIPTRSPSDKLIKTPSAS